MKKRLRRFEPAYGVSRPMLEAEARAVNREVETYLRYSLNDLRQKLAERGSAWNQADEQLHAIVLALPERERLALQCLIVRDQHHILELYLEWARSHMPSIESPVPAPKNNENQEASLPFSEWLFGT